MAPRVYHVAGAPGVGKTFTMRLVEGLLAVRGVRAVCVDTDALICGVDLDYLHGLRGEEAERRRDDMFTAAFDDVLRSAADAECVLFFGCLSHASSAGRHYRGLRRILTGGFLLGAPRRLHFERVAARAMDIARTGRRAPMPSRKRLAALRASESAEHGDDPLYARLSARCGVCAAQTIIRTAFPQLEMPSRPPCHL